VFLQLKSRSLGCFRAGRRLVFNTQFDSRECFDGFYSGDYSVNALVVISARDTRELLLDIDTFPRNNAATVKTRVVVPGLSHSVGEAASQHHSLTTRHSHSKSRSILFSLLTRRDTRSRRVCYSTLSRGTHNTLHNNSTPPSPRSHYTYRTQRVDCRFST
jgi:hypothetical protein